MAKWVIDFEIPYEGGHRLYCETDEECVKSLNHLHPDDRQGATVRPEATVEYDWFEFIKAYNEGGLAK